MLKIFERLFHDRIATENISFSGSERYRGRIEGCCSAETAAVCAKACPVQAFMVTNDEKGYAVDYKRCIFCGHCVEACMKAAAGESELHHVSEDVMPVLLENAQQVTAEVIHQKLGRSLHARHLDAGSCNACDFEMGAMSNPIYDLHRYGVHFDASPRHADVLMITGVVTRNLETALRKAYECMPEPKLVIACGACAAGGNTYGSSYAIVGAADKVVPVDIFVPGCPPRPTAMIAALLTAADMLSERL